MQHGRIKKPCSTQLSAWSKLAFVVESRDGKTCPHTDDPLRYRTSRRCHRKLVVIVIQRQWLVRRGRWQHARSWTTPSGCVDALGLNQIHRAVCMGAWARQQVSPAQPVVHSVVASRRRQGCAYVYGAAQVTINAGARFCLLGRSV